MAVLVLHYTVEEGYVGLEARLLKAGGTEQPWRVYPRLEYKARDHSVRCEVTSVNALSTEIHRVLAGAVDAMGDSADNLDHRAAQGYLQELRSLGTELQRRLLPTDLTEELHREWAIQHIIFECDPRLSNVPFDLIFLWEDFLCYQFATGKRLLSPGLPGPARKPPHQGNAEPAEVGCRGFSLVDPEGSLQAEGAKRLRVEFERFLDSWETLTDGRGRPARERIDFSKIRAFRPVRKADLENALQQYRMVNLVCHHVVDPQCPERSGFVLSAMSGKPAEVFTAADLAGCLGPGTIPPWVMLAIACRSGTLEGWNSEWMHLNRLYGMVDAAMRAGVHHYLGAIVKIPADRSPGLLLPFYRHLIEGNSVGQALRAARQTFRVNLRDPLDAGTALGLAFVLYGDPTVGYFCAEGHVAYGVPQVICEAMEQDGTRCGRVVCQKDASFGSFRCARHAGPSLKCSAGHPVANQEQLTRCQFEGCRNSVCSDCAGYGQGLCWEHCCYDGHPIPKGTQAKRCPDPTGIHPGENRSVCPQDNGWLQGLCRECMKIKSQVPPSCPHCGRFIVDDPNSVHYNPWSDVICDCCQRPLCAACNPWYLTTRYCRNSRARTPQQLDDWWIDNLEERGRSDSELATQTALRAALAMSESFQEGVAASLKEWVRWYNVLPRLWPGVWDVIFGQQRCWRGVRFDVCDLRQTWNDGQSQPHSNDAAQGLDVGKLRQAWNDGLRQAWKLPQNPAWGPPKQWTDLYVAANQLRVHLVRGLLGAPVIVAVATLTPVRFQRQRGPVFTPASQEHVDVVKRVLSKWCKAQARSELADTYLVLLSTTGWEGGPDTYAQYGTRFFTVVAAPGGKDFRVLVPPLLGKPDWVRDFVSCLRPQSVSERLERLVQWMKVALKTRSYLSAADVQDELETEWKEPVDMREILAAFEWLERDGYQRDGEYKDTIRPLPPARRLSHHLRQRRWQSRLAWTIAGAGAGLSMVSYFWRGGEPERMGLGLLMLGGAWILNVFSKLIGFRKNQA